MRLTYKAQMEIMGLAIIFILIGLGILFYLQFAGQANSGIFQKTFKEAQIENILNLILATSSSDNPQKTNCLGKNFADILEACATAEDLSCFEALQTGRTVPIPSCDFARKEIDKILKEVYHTEYGKEPYYFTTGVTGSQPLFSLGIQCTGSKRQGSVPLPIKGGILRLTLDLCI